jgi:hypothetical protein
MSDLVKEVDGEKLIRNGNDKKGISYCPEIFMLGGRRERNSITDSALQRELVLKTLSLLNHGAGR